MEIANDQSILLVRLLLATIFLSTGISKIKNFDKSVNAVREFKLIPNFFSKPFSLVNISSEMVIGIFLILGISQKIISIFGILLIIIYTLAITINLFKGRTNFSCGCGGVLESTSISWWLIIRNSLFLVGLLYLFFYVTDFLSLEISFRSFYQDVLSFQFLISIFLTCSLYFIYEILLNNLKILHHISGFSKNGKGVF